MSSEIDVSDISSEDEDVQQERTEREMNNDDECHIRSALQKTAHCSLLRNYMPPATLLYNGTADLQTQDPRQGRSNHDSFCDLFICVTQILNVTFFIFIF